jgi:cytoskeletal protein RodZ
METFMADNEMNNELTAGQMLKAARTTGRRKRELSTIARLLCIKEEFLAALENDDFKKLPELVYILGFARNYAMELELDPYVVIDKIKKQLGLKEEVDEIEIDGENNLVADKIKDNFSTAKNFLSKNKKNVLIVAASIVALIFIGTVSVNVANKVATEQTQEVTNKYNLPIAQEYGLRNRDYATVVLQATGTTWIQVKNSTGTVVFEHSMVAGDVYYALNGTTATIGNAGALDIWVNGNLTPKIGGDHQRISDLVLSPENLLK